MAAEPDGRLLPLFLAHMATEHPRAPRQAIDMAWRAWLHGWTVGWREGARSRIEDVPSVPTDWVDLDRGD